MPDAASARAIAPRTLLACALASSLVIACLSSLVAAFASLFFGGVALLCARVPARLIYPRFLTVNFFILLMWLIVPWSASLTSQDLQERILFKAGFLRFSHAGFLFCLLITLKANALLAVFGAFLARLSFTALGGALGGLGCPPKLILLFLFMERNVHILKTQWQTLDEAAKLRGFVARTSSRSYKTLAAMLACWFLRAHDHARILREALLLRGFSGQLPKTAPFAPTRSDWLLCLLTLAACACLLTLNHYF